MDQRVVLLIPCNSIRALEVRMGQEGEGDELCLTVTHEYPLFVVATQLLAEGRRLRREREAREMEEKSSA